MLSSQRTIAIIYLHLIRDLILRRTKSRSFLTPEYRYVIPPPHAYPGRQKGT